MNKIFSRRSNNNKRSSSKNLQAPHHQLSPSFSSPEPLHLKLSEDAYPSSKGLCARSPIADTFLSSTSRAEDSSIQSAIPNSSLFDDILHELNTSQVSSPPLSSVPMQLNTSSQVVSDRSRVSANEGRDFTLNRQTQQQQQQLQHPALFPSTMTGTQTSSSGSSSSSDDESHHHYDKRSSNAPVATLVPQSPPPSKPSTGNTKSATAPRMHKSMLPAFKRKSRSIPDSDASDSDAGSSTTVISSVEDASQSSQKQNKHKSDPHILSPEILMGRMKERHRQECRRSWVHPTQQPLPPSPQQQRHPQLMQYRHSPSMPTIYPLDSLVHPHMTHSESFSPSMLHAMRRSPSPEPSASYQSTRQSKPSPTAGVNVTSMPNLDIDYTRSPLASHQHYHPTIPRAHMPSSPSMLRYQHQYQQRAEESEGAEIRQQQQRSDLTEQPLRRTVCWTDSVGQQQTKPKRGRSLPSAFASQPTQAAQALEQPSEKSSDLKTKPTLVHSHQLLPPTPPPDLSQQQQQQQKGPAVQDISAMRQTLLAPKPLDELDAFRHSLPDLATFAAEEDDSTQHISRRASKSMSNLNGALDKTPLESHTTEDTRPIAPTEVPGIQYDPQQHQLVTLTEMPTIFVSKDKQAYHILIPNTVQTQQSSQHHYSMPVCGMPIPWPMHCHCHQHHSHTASPLLTHTHCKKHATPVLCSHSCQHQEQRTHGPQEEQQRACNVHCGHRLMHKEETSQEHRRCQRTHLDSPQSSASCGYHHHNHHHHHHHHQRQPHHHPCRHKKSAGRSRHHRHHHTTHETSS
ncbi:hypothetical protein BCR43DRAFT_483883 [Syncephalastrum racemosum]|uniref:Uncharacterized protein n=1 Tax=Syncephalastrum racemosum TaxID=13706 RepID=A0A1X2HXD4_SYNRA|nr:hypothetical protein BCR43DRAFT_483883 [Syncephalastrum racemosum]